MKNFYFKNIKISCCNLKSAVEKTIAYLGLQESNYICVTDVGNIITAYKKSPELKDAINNSLISLPDGRPLSIFAQIKGIRNIDRVAGPDFMQEIFKSTSNTNIKHFFLGDTDNIHHQLKKKILENYDIEISGSYSPEFDNWNSETDKKIIAQINNVQPDIIWVSFGGGKQEIWMKNNYKKINKGIMIGVGAAYRFYLGKIKRAPLIIQRLGFEWLFRLKQQPKKMFKRYATTLPYFFFYSLQEILKDNSKIKNK